MGGWRRLNVILTPAKWQTILVPSIRSPELAGVNPLNRGATALRNFIAYGERQGEPPPQPAGPTTGESNDFEDAVAEARSESAGWASNAMAPRIRAPRPPETGTSYGIWSCGTSVGAFTAFGLRTGSGIRIRPSSQFSLRTGRPDAVGRRLRPRAPAVSVQTHGLRRQARRWDCQTRTREGLSVSCICPPLSSGTALCEVSGDGSVARP